MNKSCLTCNRCAGDIENKSDLVVTTYGFRVVAYHYRCYAEHSKKRNRILMSDPINSTTYTVKTIICSLICTIFFFKSKKDGFSLYFIFLILPLILIYYRIISYYFYERKL